MRRWPYIVVYALLTIVLLVVADALPPGGRGVVRVSAVVLLVIVATVQAKLWNRLRRR